MSATVLQSVSAAPSTARRVSKSVIAGRVITGLALAFMTFDVTMKLAQVKEAVEGTAQLGFDPNIILPLGLIQLACLILYVIPRTAPLGAAFLTAYLGGAVAIHVRLGNPMFTHILSPVYVAIFLWVGLYLRDPRVRAVLGRTR
ncbi:MAG: DoxX family protein [Gemmatimonas sp.]